MFCSSGYETKAPSAFQGVAMQGSNFVRYESLNPLQKRLLKYRAGTATTNGTVFNLSVSIGNALSKAIPICDPHPEKVLDFVHYLIIVDPENVRDFWINATKAEIVAELKSNVAKYFQIIESNQSKSLRVDLKRAMISEQTPVKRSSTKRKSSKRK
jgi:hypothetical protein